MLVIGIAGGVGSGKSSVADELASLGAVVLDADQAGHDVLGEIKVRDQLVGRWGASVTGPSGEIDRTAVAGIVFAGTSEASIELSFLEELIHPHIARRLEAKIVELQQAANQQVLVLDAAVMFKAGWDRFCDRFVFVEASEPVRFARCLQRGWTAEEFQRREASQESLGLKRNRADWLIDNSGTRQQMSQQVVEIWDQVTRTES